jgi:parallel beta-helix repeat protein
MKPTVHLMATVAALVTLQFCTVSAATRYVWLDNPDPKPPYTDWATAARVIQDAVDAAAVGDEIVVTNGTYAIGGRAVYGTMTNRVAVDKPLTLRSVNGPQFTIIKGYQVPGTTNGDGAIRCVYLTNGANLCGFTLTNGATRKRPDTDDDRETSGGGSWCDSTDAEVTNCVLAGNSANVAGGGAYSGTLEDCTLTGNSALEYGGGISLGDLSNCVLSGNSAGVGGGAHGCTLNNSTLTENSAEWGGGTADCVIYSCTLTGNSAGAGGGACRSMLNNCSLTDNASGVGGGAYGGTLKNCTLTGNSAQEGGGAYGSRLNNCTLAVNSASASGGGAESSSLNKCTLIANSATNAGGGAENSSLDNCTLTGNSARDMGGGAYESTLNNCTLTGNSAANSGGGTYGGTLNNCIVYFNTAPNSANHFAHDWQRFAVAFCCTTPLPMNGVGNITNAPLFVDAANGDFRLQPNSPCINAGNIAYAPGPTDLDGNPRIVSGTVDIGAYEYQGAGSTISYAWLERYGLPTDGSADTTDPDADGLNTWQEWRCQTDPTNALSVLRLLSATLIGTNVVVRWPSVEGVSYFIERSAGLSEIPTLMPLATDVPGQPGTTAFLDTNTATAPRLFYRVGVP